MQRVEEREEHSRQPCPVCGAHRLAVEQLPHIDVMGVQPYSDLIAMGDLHPQEPPAILCLECGSRWNSLEALATGAVGASRAGQEPEAV
jgi:hypothetical protein